MLFSSVSVCSVYAESIKKDNHKTQNVSCVQAFLSPLFDLFKYCLSKSLGIVESANLFQVILHSSFVFREYAKSIYYSQRQVSNRFMRIRRKSLSVDGDYSNFGVVLFVLSRLQTRQKYLKFTENTPQECKRI
jgi:hypothetical protein